MKQRLRGTCRLHHPDNGGGRYSEIPVRILIDENACWNEEYEGDRMEKQYYRTDPN